MLLFSTMLNITPTMTEQDFIRLLLEENRSNPHDINRIAEEKLQWDGEQTDNMFGDDDLSLQTVKYRNGNIMAARFEKREPNGQYWRTDYVWNLNERRMSIRLSRVYSEDATASEKKYFPGKLVLHSRAKKALKDAVFEDVRLVYLSLKLLGTTYWQMRNGSEVTRADFDKQCAELGIEESSTISDVGAGEQGDTYNVTYHGKSYKMDRHLKKGTARENRLCMRIYFFWDDLESAVVICSLPEHLDIKSS